MTVLADLAYIEAPDHRPLAKWSTWRGVRRVQCLACGWYSAWVTGRGRVVQCPDCEVVYRLPAWQVREVLT